MAGVYVRVKNKMQLQAVLKTMRADAVLLDFDCAFVDAAALKKEHPGIRLYLQLPDILREKKDDSVKRIAERAFSFDGIVIKTFDEIGLIKGLLEDAACEGSACMTSSALSKGRDEYGGAEGGLRWQIIGDSSLYAYNTEALAFYKSFFSEMIFILPDELTDREMSQLIVAATEQGIASETEFVYKVYGYQPLMITNQCLRKNYTGCEKQEGPYSASEDLRLEKYGKIRPINNNVISFTDEKKNRFFAVNECSQCYNIIYNGQPTVMLDKLKKNDTGFVVDGQTAYNLLLDFTIESESEIQQILNDVRKNLTSEERQMSMKNLTRGHHYKGVE